MAGALLSTMPKPVQELSLNGNELPERYIHGGHDGPIDVACPLLDVPVVDLGLLGSSSPAGDKELNKLQSALQSSGCFQVINHGMTNSFIEKVREMGKAFFALPMEEKQKYGRTIDDTEGYGNDTILSDNEILNWTDRLKLTISPQDQRKLKVWPENPECFRDVLEEYTSRSTILNELLLTAMARSLQLGEDCFLDQYGDQAKATITARFSYYPPSPRPDLTLGIKPHSDASAITFLLQDKEVEGLQVLKDDQWFRVPIVPNAILVNLGDLVEIMSNGVFKSPVHRVVTNSERERITLAVFISPGSDREIGPEEKLITEERPRLYKKVKNYLALYLQRYQQGKRPIEAAKVVTLPFDE